eukprot:535187_1
MAASLLVFIATLVFLANADLTCKGVEYDIAGFTTAVPADVCFASVSATTNDNTYSSSTMLACENNEIIQNTYSSSDCTGDAISSISMATIYSNADWITSYCHLPECEYVKIRTYVQAFYNQDDCDAFDASTDHKGYSEVTYIKDYCTTSMISSSKYTCDNNIGSINVYKYNKDCSNTPDITHYSADIGCVTNGNHAATAAVQVTCGKGRTPSPTGPGMMGTPAQLQGSPQNTHNAQNNNACIYNAHMTIYMLLCFSVFMFF